MKLLINITGIIALVSFVSVFVGLFGLLWTFELVWGRVLITSIISFLVTASLFKTLTKD